ncbi:S8 family serine peptidase [Nocardioides sp. CPCC 205120]|uniref:S8 family peptidase n=1 Tax=Nocardioides sp. CPCC 205120 TaxID=3406462 RepID=UPI003B50D4B3
MLSVAPSSAAPGDPGAEPLPIPQTTPPSVARAPIAPGVDLDTEARQSVFVQVSGAGAADAAAQGSASTARRRATDRRAQVQGTADRIVAAARAKDSGAAELYTVANAVPGVAISANTAAIRALATQPGVVKVSRITERTLDNSSAAGLVRANQVWSYNGNTGDGVRIGVIDTGVDYTHATFGGPGTVEAFEAAQATSTEDGWLQALPAAGRAKVVGGYDFVGDDYNADDTAESYNPVPSPDPNPLDCQGHGSHVAGSAAGYGVMPDGSTFAGDYATVGPNTLRGLKIGPGMAPQAEIFALRVFGCEGSTDQVIAALDWSLDPNGDGDFSDRLDVVNMSLGSAYVPSDDPQNEVVDALTRHGVLTVASNGNEGDITDAGGSPGSATSSLAVASSVDAMQRRDAIRVTAPSEVAGTAAGQFSTAYPFATSDPVAGTVATVPGANADGCQPFSATDAARVAGKVAWLEWDDNDATRRCGSGVRSANAREAGAIGAIFTSELDVFGAGILGDAQIPVIQLTGNDTDRLRPAAEAGTLAVQFDGSLAQSVATYDEAIVDTVSGFTSRGGHGTYSGVKPDVAAPGDTISSAAVGSGNGIATMSGTSMAAPVTAGVAALVLAQHPSYSPLEVKAAVMNTATNDLFEGASRSGDRYGPARVGAGRIDARYAAGTSTLAWTNGNDNPVSATFGIVNAPITTEKLTRQKTITVRNDASRAVTYQLGYQAATTQPGVGYSLSASSLTVPARSQRSVTLTMTVYPRRLARVIDPTMATEQLGVPRQFVTAASGRVTIKSGNNPALRVPVHGVARPNSTTTSTVTNDQLVLDGAGVAQGGNGVSGHRSMVSVLELGARSGQMPLCTGTQVVGCVDQGSDRGMDLQAVGAGATDDYLWFGIDTWGDWATVGRANIPFVDYDIDGDGSADVETYLQFFTDTDVLYSVTVDLRTGATLDQRPVNFYEADRDTNVFDTDVALLPVSKAALGLPTDGSSAPITYVAGVFDAATGGLADTTRPVAFDAGTPAVATAGPVFADTDGATIDLLGAGGKEALVLHLLGAPGQRSEIVPVPASAG